jgi:hypothetical protein
MAADALRVAVAAGDAASVEACLASALSTAASEQAVDGVVHALLQEFNAARRGDEGGDEEEAEEAQGGGLTKPHILLGLKVRGSACAQPSCAAGRLGDTRPTLVQLEFWHADTPKR